MKTILYFFTHLLIYWLLFACNPTDNVPSPDADPAVPTQGTPTEAGKPVGQAIVKKIGPEGGTISTPDKLVTLTFPSGALSSETTISIQPVENKAWSGTGLGYELSPKNLELAKPAELSWNYSDSELSGSAPEAVGIAFQQVDRSWLGQNNVIVDRPKRKVTAPVKKLLPAAFFTQYSLFPNLVSVAPTERLELSVWYHPGFDAPTQDPVPIGAPIPGTKGVKSWKLNGRDLHGKIDPQIGGISQIKDGASATYLAPNRIPKPNQVTVSVEIVLKNTTAKLILFSNLTIRGANNFRVNGTRIDSAEVIMIGVADGQLLQIGLGGKSENSDNQTVMDLNIMPFWGVGSYEVRDNDQVSMHAYLPDGKRFADSYSPRGGGRKVYGPLVVYITEYDSQKKRVAGHLTGSLHYYDSKSDSHETAAVFAQFRAASPY